jgi:hypothetical protein
MVPLLLIVVLILLVAFAMAVGGQSRRAPPRPHCRAPPRPYRPTHNVRLDEQHGDIFDRIQDLDTALARHAAEEERLARRMGIADTAQWRGHVRHHGQFRQHVAALRSGLVAHINTDDRVFAAAGDR